MSTDPGDLCLDPTCGSGTTAYVAEQWGRRWITIDTSRVALTLARTRLMAARFPYYLLADSAEGRTKEAELSGKPPPGPAEQFGRDIRKGFVYRRVPHVTLKSIANNPDIKEGMTREEIDAAIRKHAETETLYDQPYEDKNVVRVAAALPKAVRFNLRLALIHHLVTSAADGRDPLAGSIGEESMRAGEELARWFAHEAERVYAAIAEPRGDRTTRLLAEWVARKGGRVRARDLQRSNGERYPTAAAAELALDALASAGLGEWVDEPSGPKGGTPAWVFVLRPRPDTRHYPTQPPGGTGTPGEPVPDTNPDARPRPPPIPGKNGVVSGCVGCRAGPTDGDVEPKADRPPAGDVSDGGPDLPGVVRRYRSDDRPHELRG
jgi:hypothetical protein